MELKDYRREMDRIDRELTALFVRRMRLAEEIAAWKRENAVPVLDAAREREKLRAAQLRQEMEQSAQTAREYRDRLEKEREKVVDRAQAEAA